MMTLVKNYLCRLWRWLVRRREWRVSGEDPTAWVWYCKCGNEDVPIINNWEIVRCPQCGRGYQTEFIMWQYPPEKGK